MKKGVIIGVSLVVALIVGGFKIYTAELKKQAAEQEKAAAIILADAAKQEKQRIEKESELTSKKAEEIKRKEDEINRYTNKTNNEDDLAIHRKLEEKKFKPVMSKFIPCHCSLANFTIDPDDNFGGYTFQYECRDGAKLYITATKGGVGSVVAENVNYTAEVNNGTFGKIIYHSLNDNNHETDWFTGYNLENKETFYRLTTDGDVSDFTRILENLEYGLNSHPATTSRCG